MAAVTTATAHSSESATGRCHACDGDLVSAYFRVNGHAVCRRCERRMAGSGVHAVLGGLLAAGLSGGIYYAILSLFEIRFTLVAVLAGVMVGTGVRRGRGYRVPVPYRLLALALTYLAVVSTYAHSVLDLPEVSSPWAAWIGSLVLPLRMAIEGKNIVSLILLIFGLHEAWQFSAPPVANVEGPFETSAG